MCSAFLVFRDLPLCNSKRNLYKVFYKLRCFFLQLGVYISLREILVLGSQDLLQAFILCFFRVLVRGSVIPLIYGSVAYPLQGP